MTATERIGVRRFWLNSTSTCCVCVCQCAFEENGRRYPTPLQWSVPRSTPRTNMIHCFSVFTSDASLAVDRIGTAKGKRSRIISQLALAMQCACIWIDLCECECAGREHRHRQRRASFAASSSLCMFVRWLRAYSFATAIINQVTYSEGSKVSATVPRLLHSIIVFELVSLHRYQSSNKTTQQNSDTFWSDFFPVVTVVSFVNISNIFLIEFSQSERNSNRMNSSSQIVEWFLCIFLSGWTIEKTFSFYFPSEFWISTQVTFVKCLKTI